MQSYQPSEKNSAAWPDKVMVEDRDEIPEIAHYLDDVLDQLTSFVIVYKNGFDAERTLGLLQKHLPEGSIPGQKQVFIEDILRLASLFDKKTQSGRMNLQLEIVTTDMCRLFHVDFYRQRLLCTYLGPGTEWLDHSNVDRNALGKGSNDNIVKDVNAIHRAHAFDVLMLKGKKYGEGELAVVHRSPPIVHDNKTRVLLKIDE